MCILVKKVSRLCQVFGLVSAKKLDKTTGVCLTFNGNGAQD